MNVFISTKEEFEGAIYKAIREATKRQWLTTNEVMEMLQCSRRHIQYLRDSRQIQFSQNGRTIRYKIEDVEAFLNGRKVNKN